MISSNHPVIITAQDIPFLQLPNVESNCRTNSQIDVSEPFSENKNASSWVESNCACPTNSMIHLEKPIEYRNKQSYQCPPLYLTQLSCEYHLAFNPTNETGVVVLNQVAKSLLSVFQQPYTLQQGVNQAGNPPNGFKIVTRLVDLGLLQVPEVNHNPSFEPAETLTVWLHVTNECNLRCPYCFVAKTPDRMSLETGLEAIAAVFRSAIAHNFRQVKLKYAGGEATLNFPLVAALHKEAQRLANKLELGLTGVILSNGIALSTRMIRELKTLGIRVMISLDGVGHAHDLQRPFINGKGSFNHVEHTLDRLQAEGLLPSISITLTNYNLNGLSDIVDYVLRRQLPFTLNFYRENDCTTSLAELGYQEDQIIAAIQAAFKIIEEKLPPYNLIDSLLDLAQLDTPHNRTCGVGDSYMVINHQGGVAKCHMQLTQTVSNIDSQDPMHMIRTDQIGIQNLPVEQKSDCRECTWRYQCAGGCPALTHRITGQYNSKSPNCRIYKTLFPEALRLEGLRLLKYSHLPEI